MARSTKTQKALNLNAAHGLLSRGSSVAEAAIILARERGISLRQAYRYLQGARALGRAMLVGEPSVPATFKILATCSRNCVHIPGAAVCR